MVEPAHHEDRQRDVGRAARPRDHVGGRRQLADVEFEVAHHAPERADDRLHLDEVRGDALDGNAAVLHRGRVAVSGNRDIELYAVIRHPVLLRTKLDQRLGIVSSFA
jgi:hypothetical protein